MPAPVCELRILDRVEVSKLYPVLKNTPQAPEADAALHRNQNSRLCREKRIRLVEESGAGGYFHFGLAQPAHQNDEMRPDSKYYRRFSYRCVNGALDLGARRPLVHSKQ